MDEHGHGTSGRRRIAGAVAVWMARVVGGEVAHVVVAHLLALLPW